MPGSVRVYRCPAGGEALGRSPQVHFSLQKALGKVFRNKGSKDGGAGQPHSPNEATAYVDERTSNGHQDGGVAPRRRSSLGSLGTGASEGAQQQQLAPRRSSLGSPGTPGLPAEGLAHSWQPQPAAEASQPGRYPSVSHWQVRCSCRTVPRSRRCVGGRLAFLAWHGFSRLPALL